MRTVVRRSLVLATLASLILSLAGAVAPVAASSDPTNTRVAGINIDATTIPQLESLMNHHRLSSVQLVQFYTHRIKKLNPELHAVITVNPNALALAVAADDARRHGDRRALLGIPIIVKDNIDTTGMPTTAGSWALAGSMPSDSFIVQRLKAAGAIILAKANLSEWANFRSAPSSSGWSGIGGQTNMAYVLDRNPCGSSSGSGVTASADLAVAAVGTETDGSIVCPSGQNGVVGIKPTLGVWSRSGIVPISADQDTAGPIARNVTDAAVLLGAGVGIDLTDAATAAQAGHVSTDYTQFLDKNALQGKRIGVWRVGTYDPTISPEVDAVVNQTVASLEAAGATVIDNTRIPIEPAYGPEFTALLCEFKTDVAGYLSAHTGPGYPKTLQDLIDFNNAHPNLEGGGASNWNSVIFDLAQATGGRPDADCQAARAFATSTAQAAINDTLATYHLDAIIAPTNGPAWVNDPINGDLGGDFSLFVGSSSPSAIAGYPSIVVPGGYAGPLPIGMSFIAGRWDEPNLIAMAFALEQATHVRVPPQFLASFTFAASPKHAHAAPVRSGSSTPDRFARWGLPLR
jgi:amidase